MSIGLDSEGLLSIYADWIAFLREKKGQFEGQLTKLQAKGGGKGKPFPVAPPAEPPSAPLQEAVPVTPEGEAPAWLFQAPPSEGSPAPVVPDPAAEEETDTWM
jgi:hypothetical protein